MGNMFLFKLGGLTGEFFLEDLGFLTSVFSAKAERSCCPEKMRVPESGRELKSSPKNLE